MINFAFVHLVLHFILGKLRFPQIPFFDKKNLGIFSNSWLLCPKYQFILTYIWQFRPVSGVRPVCKKICSPWPRGRNKKSICTDPHTNVPLTQEMQKKWKKCWPKWPKRPKWRREKKKASVENASEASEAKAKASVRACKKMHPKHPKPKPKHPKPKKAAS